MGQTITVFMFIYKIWSAIWADVHVFSSKFLMRNHRPLADGPMLISNTDFQLDVLRYATVIIFFEGMCFSFLSAFMLPEVQVI